MPLSLSSAGLPSTLAVTALMMVWPMQADELSTDRPDYTEATDSVRPGLAQLETGFQTTSHALRPGPSVTVGGPFPLLRIGLTDRLEFRLGSDGYQLQSLSTNGSAERYGGSSDTSIGAKLRVRNERTWTPAISVIAALSLPTGNRELSSAGRDPFIKLCWSKSLGRGFDAAGNANFRWNSGAPPTTLERGYSLAIGHKLPGGLRGFWEVYRISPIADDEALHWVADTGISKVLRGKLQVDVMVGHTVLARTPCWVVGAGFSIRVPWSPRRASLGT